MIEYIRTIKVVISRSSSDISGKCLIIKTNQSKSRRTFHLQLPTQLYLPNPSQTAHSANMPAGAATQLAVRSSMWDETRATRPSSHHSSRPSTRSAAPESMQVSSRAPTERSSRHGASNSHGDSGRYPISTERSSRHGSSNSHGDSGRYPISSHRPSSSHHSSHRDSQTQGSSSKSSMFLTRDKSTGKTLLKRATTAASRRDASTRDTREPTHDSTYESSRHSSTRDHGSRTSSTMRPMELTRGSTTRDSTHLSSTRARSQSHTARPMGLETRLEKIEEGMQKTTSRPTVVIVQQQAAPQRVYGSSAFCAGYMAAKRGQ